MITQPPGRRRSCPCRGCAACPDAPHAKMSSPGADSHDVATEGAAQHRQPGRSATRRSAARRAAAASRCRGRPVHRAAAQPAAALTAAGAPAARGGAARRRPRAMKMPSSTSA
eukprot:8602347-Lingulodinium_polyedra.AAC.1